MNPEKITFNPYKNEYEKILEIHRGNTKLSVLMIHYISRPHIILMINYSEIIGCWLVILASLWWENLVRQYKLGVWVLAGRG